ncbi:sensor histidine kinase [Novosphingobium sp. JCM 18896]|uniref:sensor histidine kinase n=1 Tax=Novosphingobium sp. JCM 18896 TaxID=2989731 RepID=UPI0022237C91|nr:histidine kinase [Novosphingobium sp. JCM 18896]MCW1429247.1 histidine kinase [Novosphingobium sp. JCM 18896]
MSESIAGPVRVPPRLVLASIFGLWATYFLLATLRGVVLDYEFNSAFFSRRLLVTLASMAGTALLWPLLVAMARRPLWQRVGAVMVLGLPLAVMLTTINGKVFADLDHQAKTRLEAQGGMDILRDERGSSVEMGNGRLVVRSKNGRVVEMQNGRLIIRNGDEAGEVPAPPSPPSPPAPPSPDEVSPAPSDAAKSTTRVIVAQKKKEAGFWEDNADLILGRYFLLLAWAAIYLALASAEQARAAERREGEYRRAAQAAELRSLRYQINPHFLFNTLNSLSALVMTGKGEAAERMIQTLSTFYRRSLTGDSTGDVRLEEEIGLQKLYLEIEAVRFPERLRTAIEVPQALADAPVPGMILQPLVENSIKYAVAASKTPVTVTITARAEERTLVLTVSDDGPGIGPGSKSEGCGIGLANVRDRLKARFDGKASLEAGPRLGGGFATVIRLPLGNG